MAYGTVNADIIGTSVAGSNLGAGNATVFKNRIINGDMRVDQRNAGASGTSVSGSAQTVDRWGYYGTQASKITWQQNAASVTPPAGFTNYLGFTSSSAYSVLSSDRFIGFQYIEGLNFADLGWGTADAKTVTLSAWVRSSLTGTFGGCVQNSAANRSYPFSYTISSANTWTQIAITIPGDTTGTWLTTNGIGASIVFSLGMGSTYSNTAGAWAAGNYQSSTGATSVVGTNGATFYITGVQLEVGSSATGFEYMDYGRQLIQCQRYYTNLKDPACRGVATGGTSGGASRMNVILPVTMRTTPSISVTGTFNFWNGSATSTGTTIVATFGSGNNQVEFDMNTSAAFSQGQACVMYTGSGGNVLLSAEL